MIAAALFLAMSVLAGSGPVAVRQRAGALPPRDNRIDRRRPAPDPFADASALDVLAVCLEAGMSVAQAAAATARSAPPPLRAMLQRAADLLTLGADPETAWSAGAGDLEPLSRLARRSASSGTALAQGVRELADQLRQDALHAAAANAERAGVLIAGPLGLCFLPAFVCLGVVPVVVGLAGGLLRSGIV